MAVGAEDVVCAVDAACSFLADVAGQDWCLAAGDLTWTCRATAEHVASDLIAYAGQLIAEPSSGYVPFDVRVEADATNDGLVSVIRTTGGLLAAAVATVAASARGWHPYGTGDREAFAAMGIVETFVHTHDIAQGLGATWSAPQDICVGVLLRLFPDRPQQDDPWPTLLWCTGRTDLGRLPRRAAWRWQNEPARQAPAGVSRRRGGGPRRPAPPWLTVARQVRDVRDHRLDRSRRRRHSSSHADPTCGRVTGLRRREPHAR